MPNRNTYYDFRFKEFPRSVLTDKSVKLRTFLHYSDPDAGKELDVFGRRCNGLFYNYDDRLYGKDWTKGLELAATQATPESARYYEIALNHFHHTDNVDLQHVILGCNRSNGFSYLIFGYTYKSEHEEAKYSTKQLAKVATE